MGLGTRCGAGDVPVSSLFWVRSAGQELLVTPTSEAVTWGSPLYTFMWLLDIGSWKAKGQAGQLHPGPGERLGNGIGV